jgi:hypothetical protein
MYEYLYIKILVAINHRISYSADGTGHIKYLKCITHWEETTISCRPFEAKHGIISFECVRCNSGSSIFVWWGGGGGVGDFSAASRACICLRLIAQESIPPGWESIHGLLKSFTNTGSGSDLLYIYKKVTSRFSTDSEP